ncbi:hypothetical protein WJX73_008169 [Symbiochloris irregularis]|uniref:Enoyl reductase (ER) domain-containing protein n=1 Tax=Symbiochloris irregularis TaxID=706552 RepID=A0AAW1PI97_9CHLO
MRAVRVLEPGPPESLRSAPVPVPVRRPGEITVAVHATSVNPIDLRVRNLPSFMVARNKILGGDIAGTVEECDPLSQFRKGDRVFGMGAFYSPIFAAGAYAEKVCINEKHMALIPDAVSFEQAAATPLVALTAWQALKGANVGPGQRVLIHAGSGGVGHVAIQFAKSRGAHVTTTCSADSAAFVRSLGADEVIDYRTQRFEDACQREGPFDFILDVIGGEYEKRSLAVCKRKGTYAHIFSAGWALHHGMSMGKGVAWETWEALQGYARSFWSGPRYKLVLVQPSGHDMTAIARLMKERRLTAAVDRSFPLESAGAAHRHLESGHPKGKVVIKVLD